MADLRVKNYKSIIVMMQINPFYSNFPEFKLLCNLDKSIVRWINCAVLFRAYVNKFIIKIGVKKDSKILI